MPLHWITLNCTGVPSKLNYLRSTTSLIVPLCLSQGHRGGFPGPGGQHRYSVHNEGFSVRQSLRAGGGPLGAAAVAGAGSHRDDRHRAASVDLSGGTGNTLAS